MTTAQKKKAIHKDFDALLKKHGLQNQCVIFTAYIDGDLLGHMQGSRLTIGATISALIDNFHDAVHNDKPKTKRSKRK